MTIARSLSLFLAATSFASVGLAADGGRKLQASLTGAAEVPTPGDTDGRGMATVTVNSGQKKVCYDLRVRNVDTATMAHIHVGSVGVAGPVAVSLQAPVGGRSSGCVNVSRDLALKILKSPARYYVNVHNAAFPSGAIRGQLAK